MLGFKDSKAKVHKNRFNKKRRLGSIRNHIVFYLKITLVIMIVPVISLAFIFIYDCVTQSESFAAKTISIEGNRILSKEEIIKEAGINPGVNIFAINISKVRKKLLANPYTAEVEVSRKIPSAITIKIKEHNCLAVIDLGKMFLLNEHGEIFKEKESSDIEIVPVVQGLSFADLNLSGKNKTKVFDAVTTVLKLGQSPKSILPNSIIQLIKVDRKIGLTITAFTESRIIKLGYSNYKDKYERLSNVLNNNKLNMQNFESIYLDNGLDRVVVCPANKI